MEKLYAPYYTYAVRDKIYSVFFRISSLCTILLTLTPVLFSPYAVSVPINETGYYGFVPPPTGRGTIEIFWSCLLTLVICLWTSIHLDVPSSTESSFGRVIDKLAMTFIYAMAPEYMAAIAIDEYVDAKYQARKINSLPQMSRPTDKWTLTDCFYANMGGLVLSIPGRSRSVDCNTNQIVFLIENNYINFPPSSYDSIMDKSKADPATKGLACLQALWLLIQCLARGIQQLPLTTLELTTVAYVFFTIITYACLWHKPLNVRISSPIIINFFHTGGSITITPLPAESDAPISPLPTEGHTTITTLAEGNNPIIPLSVEGSTSVSTISPIVNTLIIPPPVAGNTPITTLSPKDNTPVIPPPVGDSMDVEEFLELLDRKRVSDINDNPFLEKLSQFGAFAFFTAMSVFYGLWHCIAWYFHFPSHTELLIWRVCTLIITASMPFAAVIVLTSKEDQPKANSLIVLSSIAGCYLFARLFMIVEVFIGLRSLPAGAFETVKWTSFIPHF